MLLIEITLDTPGKEKHWIRQVKNQQDILGQLLEPKCRYKLALI